MGGADKDGQVVGKASGAMTATTDTSRVSVAVKICDKVVPPAAEAVIGQCTYYYRPLHKEYANKDTLDGVRQWASQYDWWGQKDVVEKFLGEREELIKADSTSPDWSRHSNFLMRHIGCTHRPPDYYVSYGYYYCSTYGTQLLPKLSSEGQMWLVKVRRLLQTNMEDGLKQNMRGSSISISCLRFPGHNFSMACTQFNLEVDPNLFKKFAYGTHVPAYLDGGLADLTVWDLGKIGMQPKSGDLIFDKNGIVQGVESGVEVGKQKAGEIYDAGKEAYDQGKEAIGKAARDALQRLQKLLK
jgi:hypothetical protein